MQNANRASIEFSVNWQSQCAIHKDRYFAGKVDFWNDIFPQDMEQHIAALHKGECYAKSFDAGVLVPPFEQNRIMAFRDSQFERKRGGN
ncbi:MAG: class I SAM-dependent methyltransferase, partial [Deltaproteobacteria bacterium]